MLVVSLVTAVEVPGVGGELLNIETSRGSVDEVINFQIRTSRSDTNAHTNTLSLFWQRSIHMICYISSRAPTRNR